jgi:chemotaxis protein MotB
VADNAKNITIRVVKKKAHAGHHGGAWKVAYADFVTSMMALFIVLWIVGQDSSVKQSVASYFRDPGAFFENTKGIGMKEGVPDGGESLMRNALLQREKDMMEIIGINIRKDLAGFPELQKLLDQVDIRFVEEGLSIELREKSESFFFDVGTTALKPDATLILKAIAQELAKLPNHIIIEGHTDSRPYSSLTGYTNYELSVDRANAARRMLVANGLREDQTDAVSGYADTRLKNFNNPFDASNRRISILVKYSTAALSSSGKGGKQ